MEKRINLRKSENDEIDALKYGQ